MILDNLLRYGEAQSAAFRLSVANKGLKNRILDRLLLAAKVHGV